MIPHSSKLKSCKSSNTTNVAKVEKAKKKTKSVAESLENTPQAKRRGVYVQKKNEMNDKANTNPHTKSGKTPEKLKSQVFTLTSNAGSQYPLNEDRILTKSIDLPPHKNSKRFRSKVLSKNSTSDTVELTILQSTREIVTTPSVISEEKSFQNMNSILKWVDNRIDSKILKTSVVNDMGILKYETRQQDMKNTPEKRVKIMDTEPAVIDHFKRDDSKRLYNNNSFIDLMGSSIDGRDSEFGSNSASHVTLVHSKPNFQYDKVTANMINMSKDYNNLKKDKHYNLTIDDYDYDSSPQAKYSNSPTPKLKKSHNLKSSSFDGKRKKNNLQSLSYNLPRNRILDNKKRKNYFLDVLKEELRKDSDAFHYEPPNFYDALKVLARIQGQKILHFDEDSIKRKEKSYESPLKRRNLLRRKPPKNYYEVCDSRSEECFRTSSNETF